MKDKIKKILPYAVLTGTFTVLLILNILYHDHWLDSDMAAEMIFSKLLSEEGHLFATPNWYYSTEFRLVYTQLVMVPLFKVISSFHVIRAVTNIVSYMLMLAAYFYMVGPLKLKKETAIITGSILLLPFSETMMTHMQLGNTYMVHVIIVLFFFGMFLRLIDGKTGGMRRICLCALYVITGIVCGISGVRYLLALQCPLVITAFVYLIKGEEFAEFRNSFGERKRQSVSLKNVIKSERVVSLYYAVTGMVAAVAGYGINILYVSKNYVFQTYDSTNFISIYQGVFLERLQDAFGSLIMLMGYIPDRGVISLRGIISLMAFVMIALFGFIAVKAYKSSEGCRYFTALFFVVAFLLNTFVFVFTTSTLVPRYYITVFVFILPLIGFYFEGKNLLFDKTVVAVLLSAVLLLGSAKTTLSFITVDKNEGKREVSEFLVQNDYGFGYATYWNANIITEMTDGKIEVGNILDPESLTFFTWSTPMKYYGDDIENEYVDKKVFLLLTVQEASEYADCRTVLNGKAVFENEDYIVYSYDNIQKLHELGNGVRGGFR